MANAPTPLTDEQLDWIVRQTERATSRAAHVAVRKVRNSALVGFLILLVGVGIGFIDIISLQESRQAAGNASRDRIAESATRETRARCRENNAQNATLRAILVSSQHNFGRGKRRTTQSRRFYSESIGRLTANDCSKIVVKR